ncbi:N-acetylmuramoyl-L-alanine amidase [Rhabdaerophilum sp. SD176]|uniref:N-acetylmuramoyl-L-alanine amidase n=1 Tax=Rhabdaerophilum sp. SD176 TaxID=2983548 RepID=UPI0024DFEB7D|nr:N-acetylmuramoyl-L-alanine amidase [Rhabdaerophilum sp. SD176]
MVPERYDFPCARTAGHPAGAAGLLAGIALILLVLFLPSAGLAQLAAPKAGSSDSVLARGVHLVEDPNPETFGLVVDLSGEVAVRHEVLAEPNRLVIDLENTVFGGSSAQGSTRAIGPVTGWRAGLFLMGRSRIVLDLNRPFLVQRTDFVRQGPHVRLVIQLRAASAEEFARRVEEDQRRRLASRVPAGRSVPRPAGAKPLVVLDPGHGGIDPGASGPKGEAEKDIVLAVARLVRKQLEADGRVEVQMTREEDRFISLSERVTFARNRSAALFVSLHADSLFGEADVRGASVYTLSDRASDAAAARAAEKENRADVAAGLDAPEDQREGVDDILFDLARRETRLFSQLAARGVAQSIQKAGRLHKTPLRSAGFRVLRAPDMPSILVELGYLSNPEDLQALMQEAGRQKLAQGLAVALLDFVLNNRIAISAKPLE